MSVCSGCGSALPKHARANNSYRAAVTLSSQIEARKPFIRTGPFWKIVSGIVVIIAGLVVASLSSSFAPAAVIIMVMGLIVVALGVMNAKAPIEHNAYQT